MSVLSAVVIQPRLDENLRQECGFAGSPGGASFGKLVVGNQVGLQGKHAKEEIDVSRAS